MFSNWVAWLLGILFPSLPRHPLFSSPSCDMWGVGLCLNVLPNARSLDRRQPFRTPPPLSAPRPKPPLVQGGGFFIWFLRGPQLESAFFDEAGRAWLYGPNKIRLGRKSAFPSTPTQTPVSEWYMCEQLPPTPRAETVSPPTFPYPPQKILQVKLDCFWWTVRFLSYS